MTVSSLADPCLLHGASGDMRNRVEFEPLSAQMGHCHDNLPVSFLVSLHVEC
jgi:hypothetical protein